MTARRSWAERALPTLARGLPSRHREWVEALRAELAALDDPAQRTAFAASAARAVWRLMPSDLHSSSSVGSSAPSG